MLVDPGENESSQNHSKKNSNKPFTSRPRRSGPTRRRSLALVQEFLEDTYGVEYSYPSCRRLLKEAGLSYQKPRRTAADSEEPDQAEFNDEIKKSERRWTPQ